MVDYILLYGYTIYCLSSHSLLYIWVVPTFLDHCKKCCSDYLCICIWVSSVQPLSRVWLFETPWPAALQASPITNSWSLLKLMSIESVMPSSHLILCHPLLFLPSVYPRIRVFSNESVLHMRWPKDWSFSFSIVLPMNIQDWFPLGWTRLISLQSKGLSKVFSNTTVQNISSSVLRFLYSPTLTSIHDYWRNHTFG